MIPNDDGKALGLNKTDARQLTATAQRLQSAIAACEGFEEVTGSEFEKKADAIALLGALDGIRQKYFRVDGE